MAPYLLVFVLIIALSAIMKGFVKKNNKTACLVLIVLIFIVLTLFGGLRSINLGYDAKMYIVNTYRILDNDSSLVSIFSYYGLEKGYILLMYLAHQITPEPWLGLLFLNALANIGPLYFIFKNRKKYSVLVAIPAFYCTLYLFSFNTMRQCVAMSAFFIALVMLQEKKYAKAFLLGVFGFFFHRSIAFSAILLAYIWIYKKDKISVKTKTLYSFILMLLSICIVLLYEPVIAMLGRAGILDTRYASYIDEGSTTNLGRLNIEYSMLYLKAITIIICYSIQRSRRISKENKETNSPYFNALFIDFITNIVSYRLSNTDRITWYIYYPALFIIMPQISVCFKKNNALTAELLAIIAVSLFMLEKLLTNQYHIVPYEAYF